jgi:hypothetical protein
MVRVLFLVACGGSSGDFLTIIHFPHYFSPENSIQPAYHVC